MLKYVYIFFIFVLSTFIYSLPVNQCFPAPVSLQRGNNLGKQLLIAAKKNTPDTFHALLNQTVIQYRGNPKGFFDVINERDEDNFNIIQFTTLIGDVENLGAIFDALKKFYGSDVQGLFDYLITRNKRGLTILGLAEYNESKDLFELILMRSMDLIGKDKKLFLKFLTAGDYEEDAKPLGDASYDSEFMIVEMLVWVAAYVFGKDSLEFKEFINAEEKTGNNALSFAGNNRVSFFLLSYGAQMPKKYKKDPRFVQVKKYGSQLNEAVNHDNLKLFKKTLTNAQKFTDDNLFKFFSIQNGAGWNPFINAAADGKYKYLDLLLKTVDKVFAKEDKITKSLLLSNADFQGRTPLHLAILRRYYDEAKLIIDNIVTYAINKPYLYSVLSVPNELNGYTPLINAVYASDEWDYKTYEFVEYFVKKAEELFGRDSRIFYLFLNGRDYNGWTPLSYASDPQVIKLLKSYDAIDTPAKKIKGIGEFDKLKLEGEL